MKRGEVYTVNFDPSQGGEIKKMRPAVIISNNACNRYSQTITVIPLSSQINKVLPFEVLIKKGRERFAVGFKGEGQST